TRIQNLSHRKRQPEFLQSSGRVGLPGKSASRADRSIARNHLQSRRSSTIATSPGQFGRYGCKVAIYLTDKTLPPLPNPAGGAFSISLQLCVGNSVSQRKNRGCGISQSK